MKILFLISGNRVPSSRYRVLSFLPYLRAAGVKCTAASSFPQKYEYFPWLGFRPSQYLKRAVRFWHWLKARFFRYDVIVIERELFNDATTSMELRFRRIARKMVLDVDDAIFLTNPQKVEQLARISDLVVAGNLWIEEHIQSWNPNSVVIPTGVELAGFPEKDPNAAANDIPVVGWMGTSANLEYINVIAPALRNLARRCEFEMRFIVPEAEPLETIDLSGVRVRHVAWQGATEVDELRKIDIGVMPLFADREWDKYKCPTKLVQYMAIGVPGVASPIGFTADVVTHGVDGFLAASSEEWETTLDQLIRDPELRGRIGQAARKTVAAKYCVEANWQILLDAFTELSAES